MLAHIFRAALNFAISSRKSFRHAEKNRSGRVDCHASADLAEIDSIEQPSHIVDTADSDSDLAHFPMRSWMIRVKAELRWKIEGSAKSSLSMRNQILESPVGFAG